MAALLLAVSARAADVHELLNASRQRLESADYRASGHLVKAQPDGVRTSYPITIYARWFPGVLRVLVKIGESSKAGTQPNSGDRAASRVLIEMRPGGESTVLIAHPGEKSPVAVPFEKWRDGVLGTELSYEDLLEQQYFWQGQNSGGEAKFGARDCDVLESTPGPADKTHYARIRTWLDPGIGFPVYAEKTEKESSTVKEFTYFGLRHNGGVWSASQIEIKERGRPGSTLLIFDRGSARANLTLDDFDPGKLTHFQE
jgi:hypothetical protein